MNSYRPCGPQLFLLGDSNPDLTVGAITSRRFAPHEPAKRVSAQIASLTPALVRKSN
jgi:hypothetical protein